MKGLREHLTVNMVEGGDTGCGVKEGCPSKCSCSHIGNKDNKINGRNK